MRRKVVLHTDVMRILNELRLLEVERACFAEVPRGVLDTPLYRVAYELDDLLVLLNDRCYKFTEEVV